MQEVLFTSKDTIVKEHLEATVFEIDMLEFLHVEFVYHAIYTACMNSSRST